MKFEYSILLVACVFWQAAGYPYYPYYGNNFDTLSYGSSDSTRGGLVMSRYFNPYYNPRSGGAGMAAFMFKPPEEQPQAQQVPSSPYYLPDRRRQTQEENFYPQQNEVFFPQAPEKPVNPTEATELADPTEKTELIPTTARATAPELVEPEVEEVEEPVQKPKKRVAKRKQVKKPVEDEEEDDDYQPKMPASAFFPMFFGWGGRGASGGGMPGATAIANAYSTGRGGVATSHATAYGPRPDFKDYKDFKLQP